MEAVLDIGNYILVSNVCEKTNEIYPYTITSYAPTKISFSPAKIVTSKQTIDILYGTE